MIHREWQDPNFMVKARDADGNEYEFFTHAESEAELRARLESLDLEVEDPDPNYNFEDWRKEARDETQRAKDAHDPNITLEEPYKFKDAIWKKLKWHLFDLFHGKCAYCELKPRTGYHGDVEHYRPKGKVEGAPDHPGYYWLAYDITNLLPSCALCNQARGKQNQFPVVAGTLAKTEGEIPNERPLLLNPFQVEDLRQHLEFNELGRAVGKTEEGKKSVEVYHLNRPGISEERRQEQANAIKDWAISFASTKNLRVSYQAVKEELTRGARKFSAAAMDALDLQIRSLLQG